VLPCRAGRSNGEAVEADQEVTCLGYYQEESPECDGWCEVCGICYSQGYCTMERHYEDCSICHKSHTTEDHSKVVMADKLQELGIEKSILAHLSTVCEVCGSHDHRTYECCEKCNCDRHVCHLCGDPLGHDEISACYILDMMGVL
jgi:hypothetical protein